MTRTPHCCWLEDAGSNMMMGTSDLKEQREVPNDNYPKHGELNLLLQGTWLTT